MAAEIQIAVLDAISEYTSINDPRKINLEDSLTDDLGIDSLGIVELIMFIENKLGLEVPDDALSKIEKVVDVCEIFKSESKKADIS